MMKSKVVFLGVFFSAAAFGADTSAIVPVTAKFLFVPTGFDSNDQTEVVVDGYLPDACHKVVPAKVDYNESEKTFKLTPLALRIRTDEIFCADFQVPYTTSINLGVVNPGVYTVIVEGADSRQLVVKKSSTISPDDYLYAPVDQLFVDVDLSNRSITAYITGRYTNSCMRWSETKILDQGETTVVLPIIRMEDRDDCHETDMSYKGVTVKLPWRGPGRYLAHLRSLSGTSVNRVFSVDGE